MKIADFFVQIGVKGNGDVKTALSSVRTGMNDLNSTSLAAKAAVLGVFYAIERMTAASVQMGTTMQKFGAFTGFDEVRLQKWGNAFRQVSVPMEEVMSTMQNLQAAGAKFKAGDSSMAQAFGWMQMKTGVIIDPNKADDIEYMMQKGIEFMKAAKDVPNRNMIGSMLGLSPNVMQGMVRGKFDERTMGIGGVLGKGELASLDRSNVQFQNLWDRVEKNTARLVAKDLPKLLPEISKATDQILKLVDALANLADKAKVFQVMGKAIEGWAIIFGGAADMIDATAGAADKTGKGKPGGVRAMFNDLMNGDLLWKIMENAPNAMNRGVPKDYIPGGVKTHLPSQGATKQGDLTLSFNIDEAQDPQKVVDIAQRQFTEAYVQYGAQFTS